MIKCSIYMTLYNSLHKITIAIRILVIRGAQQVVVVVAATAAAVGTLHRILTLR